VLRLLALPLALVALQQYDASVRPLPAKLEASLVKTDSWRAGCPVPLSDLRLLTVTHWGFDGRPRTGQLVVHEDVARPLQGVFRELYRLRFPIRHMRLADMYGPRRARPADGDITGSFRCRQSVPSPCVGGSASGRWSNHAYGYAIDVNPVENPYVGCGMSRDPSARRYMNRSRIRKGMVTPAVVRAFAAIGWGWGGSWTGDTKDYMHFSVNGR
jgi:D-alanyl-D-alanine carboxypeptidase